GKTREGCDAALDFRRIAHADWTHVHSERGRRSLYSGELADPGGACIPDDCRPSYSWRDLFEQLKPFRAHAEFVRSKPGSIAAWPRKALDDAGTDRIRKQHEHGRYRPSCLLDRGHGRSADRQDHVRRKRDELPRVSSSALGIAQRKPVIYPRVPA